MLSTAFQNLYTFIYNDLSGDAGQALIQSAWNNLTSFQQKDQGMSLAPNPFPASTPPGHPYKYPMLDHGYIYIH